MLEVAWNKAISLLSLNLESRSVRKLENSFSLGRMCFY